MWVAFGELVLYYFCPRRKVLTVKTWRLLDTGLKNAFYNMALDEVIVTARSNNLVPNTLRFFRWEPAAVSIGYFQ